MNAPDFNRIFAALAFLSLALLFPETATAARKKASPARQSRPAQQSPNAVTIRTTDGSLFKGTLIDREESLIELQTNDDQVFLPLNEIVSINGQDPQNYFKRFSPVVVEKLFSTFDFTAGKKVTCSFRFYSNWDSVNQPNGISFVGPETDHKWNGYRFHFILESPPKLTGELNYPSVIKRIAGSGSILSESYEVIRGTRTLLTTETERAGFTSKSVWQILGEGGQSSLLKISISHQSKERLDLPIVNVLLNHVMRSLQFSGPQGASDASSQSGSSPAAAAPSGSATGTAGSGAEKEIEKAFQETHKTILSGNLDQIKKLMPPEDARNLEKAPAQMQQQVLNTIKNLMPRDVNVTKISVSGPEATLLAEGSSEGQKQYGKANLRLEGKAWKVVKQAWSNKAE